MSIMINSNVLTLFVHPNVFKIPLESELTFGLITNNHVV